MVKSVTGQINELRRELDEAKQIIKDCFRLNQNGMMIFNADGAHKNRDKIMEVIK